MTQDPAQESAPPSAQPGSSPDPSYVAAREELIEVVRRLETGGTNLEDSLALWERGEELAQVWQGWRDGAKRQLDAAIAADDDAQQRPSADS